jgi:hypothetical protein
MVAAERQMIPAASCVLLWLLWLPQRSGCGSFNRLSVHDSAPWIDGVAAALKVFVLLSWCQMTCCGSNQACGQAIVCVNMLARQLKHVLYMQAV